MAFRTETKHIDSMSVSLKSLSFSQPVELSSDGAFERRRRLNIRHLAATGTEEVVMVLSEILGKLEASELIVGGNTPDDSGRLEIDEVAIRRASGQLGKAIRNVVDANRVPCADNHIDDRATSGRIALINFPKSILDLNMEIITGLLRGHATHCRPFQDWFQGPSGKAYRCPSCSSA
jgi:hypothetical protein